MSAIVVTSTAWLVLLFVTQINRKKNTLALIVGGILMVAVGLGLGYLIDEVLLEDVLDINDEIVEVAAVVAGHALIVMPAVGAFNRAAK